MKTLTLNLPTLSLMALLSMGAAHAGEVAAGSLNVPALEPASSQDHLSIYDKIWSMFTLYKDDNNPVLQEFSLQGRIQAQWATGDSDVGEFGSRDRPDELLWDDVEIRRWRLGFKSKWFRVWKLEGQIDVNPEFQREAGANPDIIGDGFYRQIYDLYLTYAPSDAFNLSIGKHKANFFGIEQYTSSKEILTFERGLLANTLFPGELTGIKFSGKKNDFVYGASIYAGDQQREFSEFDAGWVFQGHFGYDFHTMFGMDKAQVKLDYQYSDGDLGNINGGLNFEHAFSLNGHFEKERFGLYSEFMTATGYRTQGEVWGINLIPSYYLTDGLQLVLRYQHAEGDHDSLRLQSRYERLAPQLKDGGRGEGYDAFYAGLNYYLYGHKLKLMAGAEYHDMDGGGDGGDYKGWTTLVGMRMFF